MERIIIDMDEVIADPMQAMVAWYKENYTNPVDFDKMRGSWLPGFIPEHQPLIKARLNEPGFFRNLPVMKDAVEVLKEINTRYEIFIVSAAMEFPNSLKDKYDWLQEHFPFFTWKQIVFSGEKRMVCGDYMIDDHVRHLQHFKGKPYLFTSIHNLDVTGYDRINNWMEAADIFLR
jgi:5'-nucleotidase